ncbi:hypothetical protein MCC93_16200 [Morococcus cerebrosus]|uniref:Uncharacterized protein n=1 Tax=Morococcus cerebrosus TaxID=1056807 RepID=A0A0C1E4R5_9NEIS|nr:hypothetical protein MCC93_16200 [Morococcus cerebrosus]
MSVGVLQFMPSSWHMILTFIALIGMEQSDYGTLDSPFQ